MQIKFLRHERQIATDYRNMPFDLHPNVQKAYHGLLILKRWLVTLETVSMRVAGRDTLPIRIGPAQQPNGQAKETQVIAPVKPEPHKPQALNGFTGDVVEEASHQS